MSTQEPAGRRLSQVVRHEIVISEPRSRLLRWLVAIVAVLALLAVGFFSYLLVNVNDVDTEAAEELVVFVKGFALPVCVTLLVLSTLAIAFAPRRNATFRMMLTFTGLLLVLGAVLLRGNSIGIAVTLYGLVIVALGWWPDKHLKAERAADNEPV